MATLIEGSTGAAADFDSLLPLSFVLSDFIDTCTISPSSSVLIADSDSLVIDDGCEQVSPDSIEADDWTGAEGLAAEVSEVVSGAVEDEIEEEEVVVVVFVLEPLLSRVPLLISRFVIFSSDVDTL